MKPKGGKRRGAGRPKGVTNKATREIKAAFQKYGDALVKALLTLTKSEDERVRLGAIKEALDRGYGRPAQPHTGEGGEGSVPVTFRMYLQPGPDDSQG